MSAGTRAQAPLVAADGTGRVPDLVAVSRWTVDAQRRRRRLLRSRTQSLPDVYTALLSVVVLGAMAVQALSRSRPGHGAGSLPGVAGALTDASSAWLVAAVVLLALAALAGAVRRLGPVVLRPEQSAWWLPLPGARRRLLAGRLTRALTAAVLAGVVLGGLLGLLVGTGPLEAAATALLCVGGGSLVLTAAAWSQSGGRGLGAVRGMLLLCATAALVLAVGAPSAVPGGPAVLVLGAVAVCAAIAWLLVGVLPRLERLEDAELIDSGHRAFGVSVAGLSLDTRALGRLLAPPTRPPRRLAGLRLARAGACLGARARTVTGVAQADAVLMGRQPWRLGQLAASVVVALALLIPGLAWPAQSAVLLFSAWLAVLGAAAPARQVAFDGGPDQLWPAPPVCVRVGHLVVPTAWTALWSVLVWGVAVLAGAGTATRGAAVLLLLVCLVSAVGWGAVAVRSGMRQTPDWSFIVPTPFGSLPAGLIQSLTAGPDVGLLVALPLLAAVVGGGPDTTVLAVQAAMSAAAVVWALRVGRTA